MARTMQAESRQSTHCLERERGGCRSWGFQARACTEPGRLYDAIPCGIVQFSAEPPFRVIYLNKTGCVILGYEDYADLQAHENPDDFDPLYEHDRPSIMLAVDDLLAGSETVEFCHRVHRKDGTLVWVRGTATLVERREPHPIIQAVFRDATEEETKRYARDRERYISVLCSAFAEVYEVDTVNNTCRMLTNQRGTMVIGSAVSLEQAFSRWGSTVVEGEDRERIAAEVTRFRNESGAEPLTLTYRRVAGAQTIWCQSTFLHLGPESLLCCNSDVTERMRSEDEAISRGIADIVTRLPVGIGVYALRDDGVFALYVSDQVCEMFGYTREEYDERIAQGLPTFAEDDLRCVLSEADPSDVRARGVRADIEMHRKDGTPFTVRLRGMVSRAKTGDVALYAAMLDVTDELAAQRALAWQNERYRLLSEMTRAISIDYDSKSDTARRYLDRGDGMKEHVVEHYLAELEADRTGVLHPDSIEPVRQLFARAQRGEQNAQLEYRADYFGTGYSWFRANMFVVDEESGSWHLIGLIEDIEGERELQRRAEFDLMVGVNNHATTKQLVDEALAASSDDRPNVAVLLDVDNFKQVNDRCGHLKGDELLCSIGHILRDSCRATDIVGRIGGDEFALFLRGMCVCDARPRLDALRTQVMALGESCGVGEVSVSIGAYETGADDRTYEDVFGKADEALYASKRAGKNRISALAVSASDEA